MAEQQRMNGGNSGQPAACRILAAARQQNAVGADQRHDPGFAKVERAEELLQLFDVERAVHHTAERPIWVGHTANKLERQTLSHMADDRIADVKLIRL